MTTPTPTGRKKSGIYLTKFSAEIIILNFRFLVILSSYFFDNSNTLSNRIRPITGPGIFNSKNF
jgi:hypothetical protein